MSNLLPQILRDRGLDVSDDADADALYELIMKQVRASFVKIKISFTYCYDCVLNAAIHFGMNFSGCGSAG